MTTNVHQPAWVADVRPSIRLWYVLLALPILAVMAFAIFQPIQVLPRISLAPGYSFIDQTGARFTNEDLRGKLVIYSFTATRCEAPCVQTTPYFQTLQAQLAEADTQGLPLEFVTISVDPKHDTPAVLADFAGSFQADPDRWHFITGEPTQLKNVIGGGFSTYFHSPSDAQGSADVAVDPVFALVDGWGILRAVYRTATPDPAILRRDLGLVASEVTNSQGVNRYAYEAAHLFLCYPR